MERLKKAAISSKATRRLQYMEQKFKRGFFDNYGREPVEGRIMIVNITCEKYGLYRSRENSDKSTIELKYVMVMRRWE